MPILCILTCFSSCGSLSWWRAGLWRLPPLEGFDDAHLATAVGAWLAKGERGCLCGWRVIELGLFGPEQGSDLCYVGLSLRAGEQAVVADVMKAIWKNVDEEAADELSGCQSHGGLEVVGLDPVVFPAERDSVGVGADQAAEVLSQATDAITQNHANWIALMMDGEYGLGGIDPHPLKSATTTFLSFLVAGAVPLFPFVLELENAFFISAAMTMITFLGLEHLRANGPSAHGGGLLLKPC